MINMIDILIVEKDSQENHLLKLSFIFQSLQKIQMNFSLDFYFYFDSASKL